MGPSSYMRSVVDRNVVMRRIPIHIQERQWTCKRNFEAHSRNQCCRRKAICIANSEGVSLTLLIQNSMRRRRVI
jgi:hypothetical protein